MGFKNTRFRKKPVEVEAYQITKKLFDKIIWDCKGEKLADAHHIIRNFPKWLYDATQKQNESDKGYFGFLQTYNERPLIIQTLEGHHEVSPCDWIIKGVEGELYPCKDRIFRKTYEHTQHRDDIDLSEWIEDEEVKCAEESLRDLMFAIDKCNEIFFDRSLGELREIAKEINFTIYEDEKGLNGEGIMDRRIKDFKEALLKAKWKCG